MICPYKRSPSPYSCSLIALIIPLLSCGHDPCAEGAPETTAGITEGRRDGGREGGKEGGRVEERERWIEGGRAKRVSGGNISDVCLQGIDAHSLTAYGFTALRHRLSRFGAGGKKGKKG